jgi:hypothetical protein
MPVSKHWTSQIGEYAIVQRDLNLTDASMIILLSTVEFQVQLANFLLTEHARLARFDKEYSLPGGQYLKCWNLPE